MSRPRGLAAAGVIILTTVIAYIPAMRGGFVWNDDERGSLGRNIVLEENGLYRVWFTTESVNYWPMVWTSYWLEHQLWGLNPTGYHVVNVLLHAICAVLMWRVLVRLSVPAAWAAALIFAVHPVNVESVAWITQRKNVLSLLFFLVALLWYLRFDDSRRRAWYWAAVAAFLLAMLSKGAVVTLPVVLLLCMWWRRGAISRRDVLRSLPFFFVAALMSGVEIWFQYTRAIGEDLIRDDTFLQRLAAAGWVVWFYVYKALLPIRLCFIYPRWQIEVSNWLSFLPDVALLLTFVVCWRYRRGWARPILFALACYVVTLAPVLGFVNIYFMRYSFVADHYQYVSIIAMIALVASAVGAAFRKISAENVWPTRVIAGVVVLTLGALTWQQSRAYKDAETLWRDTLDRNPAAWMAHSNLGNLLCAQGRLDQAIGHYRDALRLKDDNAEVHNNLGNALVLRGKVAEGIPHYYQALELDPTYAEANRNLATALTATGQLDQAIYRLREALVLEPEHPEAHYKLGLLLIRTARPADAIEHFRAAARLKPDWPPPLTSLAWTLATAPDATTEQKREALGSARRAVQLTERREAEALDALAAAQAAVGDFTQALATITEAIALPPTTETRRRRDAMRERLELYRQGKPYHETGLSPG